MVMRLAILGLLLAGQAAAQLINDVPVTGDRLSGFVLPIVPVQSDLVIEGTRAYSWKVDDTRRLVVEGDVRVTVGAYSFATRQVVVWINRIPSADGVITQAAMFFPQVGEPSRRAGLGVAGDDVLVTSSFRGKTTLKVPLLQEQPPHMSYYAKGDQRLKTYLQQLAAAPARLRTRTEVDQPPAQAGELPMVVGAQPPPPPLPELPGTTVALPQRGTPAIFQAGDKLIFAGRNTSIDEQSDTILVTGNAQIDLSANDPRLETGQLRLSSERAVVFLKPGTIAQIREDAGQLDVKAVEGIYLEGDVIATDGNYIMRGQQVYYDVALNRAVAAQAVLRTYLRTGIPVYARANELRQISADQFEATDAKVSISEFFTPHLSVGADRITVTKNPGKDSGTMIEADHVVFRSGNTPIFYWPYMRGSADKMVLPEIMAGYNEFRGVTLGTRWDLWALLGYNPLPGIEAKLVNDIYTYNGVGLGVNLHDQRGRFNMYGFYDFEENEQASTGVQYTSGLQYRGLIDGNYTFLIDEHSLVQTSVAWVSDGAFVNTFRQDDFTSRLEYETMAFLKLQSGNSAFSLLLKNDLDGYISNSWQLASRPYTVNKLPEAAYRRYGDSLFSDRFTWTQEYSANAMSMRLQDGTPATIAVPTFALNYPAGGVGTPASPVFFGNTDISNAYENAGYNEDIYVRAYTRQELAYPIDLAPVKVTPFVNATAIGYALNDFNGNYNYPSQTSQSGVFRGLIGTGARASAEFSQMFDGVQNAAMDINRLRYVVQPTSTVWAAYDTADKGQYPIFDQNVEGISAAQVAQIGVKQRLQTYRGGPGAWKSVDWITLDLGAVVNNSSNNFGRTSATGLAYAQSPTPSFYSWRPELSQWGSHLYGSTSWEVSSTFTAYGSVKWMLDNVPTYTTGQFRNLARGSIGIRMQHTPDTSFFIEYRTINNFVDPTGVYSNDELLQLGVNYQISKLYFISVTPQIDLVARDLRAASASLTRSFPDYNLSVSVGYDKLTQVTSFGVGLSIPAIGASTPSLAGNTTTGLSQ
ncbi:MAG: hypothetical protein K8R92_05195 [Planctomycetes bacterium]|nr:hypothetical protein [Planctomycetota bacterium]